MRKRYRMFRRRGVFWIQDSETRKQESLGTKVREEAERLFHARNEAHRQPHINLGIARAYLMVGDPASGTRTWQDVMNEILRLKERKDSATLQRWETAVKDKALNDLRALPLLETRAEHLLRAMEKGKTSTNIYLRRIHNFAIGMNWLPCPVIAKRMWPAFEFKEKRAITKSEHEMIVAAEKNSERRAFYELAWHTGASQSDIAFLEAKNIDWKEKILSYERMKSGELAFVRLGPEVEKVLRTLPEAGPLFPYLRSVRAGDRATEFKQRCRLLFIEGVSLHSYRYAWAERALSAGYPERFAQQALGHSSKAIHRTYAKRAMVIAPALETFENSSKKEEADKAGNIIPFPCAASA